MDIKCYLFFFSIFFSFLKKIERKEVYIFFSTFSKRWRLEEKDYIKNTEKRYDERERESMCFFFHDVTLFLVFNF